MRIDLDRLLRGSIDMHVHHGPDAHTTRRVDALQAAQQAQDAGMRAIVLKNHDYCTAPLAVMANKLVSGIRVFGSICLDYEVGGLNHHAVEAAALIGAKVVWMPTMSSLNSRSVMAQISGRKMEEDGFSLLDKKGNLVPEMGRILTLIKEHELVLASGHISPEEAFALVEAARSIGIWRIVITHASDTEFVSKPLSMKDQQRLAQMGAFIEYCGSGLMPDEARHDPAHMAEAIRKIGAEHCIMGTDMGRSWNPLPAEGMRIFMSSLLKVKVPEEEIEIMAKVNPARLLGLE
jgi:hypothetical protein